MLVNVLIMASWIFFSDNSQFLQNLEAIISKRGAAYFYVSFSRRHVQRRGSSLCMSDIPEPLGVEPPPGVFQHHPLLGVPRLVAIDTLSQSGSISNLAGIFTLPHGLERAPHLGQGFSSVTLKRQSGVPTFGRQKGGGWG